MALDNTKLRNGQYRFFRVADKSSHCRMIFPLPSAMHDRISDRDLVNIAPQLGE
jgi:hypothetical protein